MGAINFDATEWLRADDAGGDHAKVAKPAKVSGDEPAPALATIATLADSPRLPAMIERGLDVLSRCSAPGGCDRAIWSVVVADALRLRDEGWAATALAMGWTPEQLFGVDRDGRGVARQLDGRPILALLSEGDAPGARAMFVLDDGGGVRACLNRSTAPARMLWDL